MSSAQLKHQRANPAPSGLTHCTPVALNWISWSRGLLLSCLVKSYSQKRSAVNFGTLIIMLFWMKISNNRNALRLSCTWQASLRFLPEFLGSVPFIRCYFSSEQISIYLFFSILRTSKKKKGFHSFFSAWLLQCLKQLTNVIHLVVMLACCSRMCCGHMHSRGNMRCWFSSSFSLCWSSSSFKAVVGVFVSLSRVWAPQYVSHILNLNMLLTVLAPNPSHSNCPKKSNSSPS